MSEGVGLILMGLGLVLVIEGLVMALAPRRIDELLDLMRAMPVETRRFVGLAALAVGVGVIWLARAAGA
jgi:uncharacterized protein YjeT (DUF2065 family)